MLLPPEPSTGAAYCHRRTAVERKARRLCIVGAGWAGLLAAGLTGRFGWAGSRAGWALAHGAKGGASSTLIRAQSVPVLVLAISRCTRARARAGSASQSGCK